MHIMILVSFILTFAVFAFSRRHRTRNLSALALIGNLILCTSACTPGPAEMVQELSITIAGLIPIAAAAISILFPQEYAAFVAAANLATAGLAALSKLIRDYHANPSDSKLQEVYAAFTDVQQNLAAVEQAAQIKNAATKAKIEAVIRAAGQSLALLEANIAAKHPGLIENSQMEVTSDATQEKTS